LRAPLLELAMMAAFLLSAWRFGSEPLRMVTLWLYAWFLLTVLVIDLEHRRVLNVMVLPAAVVAFGASFLPGAPAPLDALIGGAGAFAAFFLIALLGRGAMGMGDVKLAGVIGLMTGYPLVVPALTGYLVYVSQRPHIDRPDITPVFMTTTTYRQTGVMSSLASYYFRVDAENIVGTSTSAKQFGKFSFPLIPGGSN